MKEQSFVNKNYPLWGYYANTVKTRFFLQKRENIFMPDSIYYLNLKTNFMKKHLIAFIAACSVLAACDGNPKSNGSGGDSAQQPQALMSGEDGGEAPPGSAPATPSSSFMTKTDAQAIIDAYNNTPISGLSTQYYLADASQIRTYLDYAEQNNIKDVQLIFARNEDQVTLVITGVRSDGTHILYPDPNNNNTPSVIEHVYPCPPGTNCYTSTNLSQ